MSTSAVKIGAASRAAAAAAVDAVIHNGRSLEQVIPECLTEALSPRDVTLVKALVYGALRGHCLHQCLISKLLSKPLKKKDIVLESLLSVSLFQLLESDQPDFAVVSATVDAAAVLGRPHARLVVRSPAQQLARYLGSYCCCEQPAGTDVDPGESATYFGVRLSAAAENRH
jgi:16S rRNA (cytosine967-C5)-methyltransferase